MDILEYFPTYGPNFLDLMFLEVVVSVVVELVTSKALPKTYS